MNVYQRDRMYTREMCHRQNAYYQRKYKKSNLMIEFLKNIFDRDIKMMRIEDNSRKETDFHSKLYKVCIEYNLSKDEVEENKEEEEEENQKSYESIFIKIMPKDTSRTMFNELYFNEFKIMADYLPRITNLLQQQIAPKLKYKSLHHDDMILMENISERGYITKSLQEGLPLKHCLLMIDRLAKLHAGSVAICEKEHTKVLEYVNTQILYRVIYLRLAEVSLWNVAKAIRDWPDPDEKYSKIASKLDKLAKAFRSRCSDIYQCNNNEIYVLNHGDCCPDNVMFTEDENGEPCDAILVDYQMSIYSSPVIDLHYFLNTCPQIELMYEYDDLFLDTYLKRLSSTMTSLNCTTIVPTMEELKAQMHEKRIFAVFAGLILHLRKIADLQDYEDCIEIQNMWEVQRNTKLHKIFTNLNVVRLAKKMLPIMDQRGYFD